MEIPQRKGAPVIFDQDECVRETSYEALAAMRPAFQKTGTATAGNASIISDGAAAVVVMSREKAEALGCPIMASIGAQASYGIEMKYVLVAPIWAIPKCLAKQGITAADVDLFEINEAFSGSTLAVLRELDLDPRKGQRQRRRSIPGAPHRGQRLPCAGHPAVRDGPSGQ